MMRALRLAALVAVLTTTLMAGQCTTLSGGSAGGAFCEVARPQRPSRSEILAMSPERKRELLSHNRLGAETCGWRP